MSEKETRLRIDLLESQSSAIARILAAAVREHSGAAFAEHSERLSTNRGRIEDLLRVLGEKAGQIILDLQVSGLRTSMTVRQALEKMRAG